MKRGAFLVGGTGIGIALGAVFDNTALGKAMGALIGTVIDWFSHKK